MGKIKKVSFITSEGVGEQHEFYAPSKEEREDAKRKFSSLMCEQGADIKLLLDTSFLARTILDFDYVEYGRYRKTYTDDLLNKIVDELEIENNEDRWSMACAILSSADTYISAQKEKNIKLRQSEYTASMEKLHTGLSKSLKELDPDAHSKTARLYTQALNNELSQIQEDSNTIHCSLPLFNALNSLNALSPFDLGLLIEIMKDVAHDQAQNPDFETPQHENPLKIWINKLSPTWESTSPLPLMTGKHYKESGYTAKQMGILEDIIRPLDASITNNQIGHALKSYLELQNSAQK